MLNKSNIYIWNFRRVHFRWYSRYY